MYKYRHTGLFPSKPSFLHNENVFTNGSQTLKAPISRFNFSPRWGPLSIRMSEVRKNLWAGRSVTCAGKRESFSYLQVGVTWPCSLHILSSLSGLQGHGGTKKKKPSIYVSLTARTWIHIILLSSSSDNICVVKLSLPFLQVYWRPGFLWDKTQKVTATYWLKSVSAETSISSLQVEVKMSGEVKGNASTFSS